MTKLTSFINPKVLADLITSDLEKELKFAPLATVDSTLVGNAGDTVLLPVHSYIGDATVVEEGTDITVSQFENTSTEVKVKKIAKGVEITDEAALSGYGDPIGQAALQLKTAIAQKVDSSCFDSLTTIALKKTHNVAASEISADMVADALALFGENVGGEKVLLIAPAQLAKLRKDTNFLNASDVSTKIMMEGTVGSIHGCQIVISERIVKNTTTSTYTNYIVKPGAVALFLKRDTLVETDRNIIKKTTTATVDKHFAAYLADESKAIKIICKG